MDKNRSLRHNYDNVFLIVIAIVTLFMGIGYAAVDHVSLDITGSVVATKIEDIFISEVVFDEAKTTGVEKMEESSFYETILNSKVVLSSTDSDSYLSYNITIHNNTDNDYYFAGTTYADNFYDNSGITFELEGIQLADKVLANTNITFKIIFSYENGTIADSNVLNSYIKFLFENVNDVKLVQFINNGKTQKQLIDNSETTATFVENQLTGVVVRCNNNAVPAVTGTQVKMTNILKNNTVCQVFTTLKESMETADTSINNMLMIANETTTGSIKTKSNQTINFDLNGKKYVAGDGILTNYANLKLYDSKYVKGSSSNTGSMKSNGVSFVNYTPGKLTIDSIVCNNVMDTSVSQYSHVLHSVTGESYINNATLSAAGYTVLSSTGTNKTFIQINNSSVTSTGAQDAAILARSSAAIVSVVNSTVQATASYSALKTSAGARLYVANSVIESARYDLYSTENGDLIHYASNNTFINGTATPASKISSSTTGRHIKNYVITTDPNWIYVRNTSGTKMKYSDGQYIYVGDLIHIKSYFGFLLDAASDSPASGTNIRVYNDDNTASQDFMLLASDTNYNLYNIAPFNSEGLFIDISGGSAADGTNISLYTANNTTAQKYGFVKSGSYYNIRSSKNTFMDLDNGTESPTSGTNVESWSSSNDNSQLWQIIK